MSLQNDLIKRSKIISPEGKYSNNTYYFEEKSREEIELQKKITIIPKSSATIKKQIKSKPIKLRISIKV